MLSRRAFLAGCGLAGAAGVCAGAGLPGFVWLFDQPRRRAAPILPTAYQLPRPPGMIARADWGALPPDVNARSENGLYSLDNVEGWRVYDTPLEATYQTIVIHHSVVYEQDDRTTLLEVQRSHRADRGWADVAYHYFVGRDGQVYEGRDLHVRGTHVAGHNTGSVGLCLLGNYMRDQPTDLQIGAARQLVAWLAAQLRLTHLAPHSAFNGDTVCPGRYVAAYLLDFAEAAGLTIGTEGYLPPPEQRGESGHFCQDCTTTALG